MSNVRFYKYLNYYNRKFNKPLKLEDYPTPVATSTRNFDFADGVMTKAIIGKGDYFSDIPDYCTVESNGSISRWFVVEAVKTRGGQFELTLYRDLVADYWDELMGSTCYVRRGMLTNSSPLIYAKEPVEFNQIKKQEITLSNSIGSPWYVAYVAKTDAEGQPLTYTGTCKTAITSYYGSQMSDVNLSLPAKVDGKKFVDFNTVVAGKAYEGQILGISGLGNQVTPDYLKPISSYNTSDVVNSLKTASGNYYTYASDYITKEAFDRLLEYKNKIIYDGTNYYRVDLKFTSVDTEETLSVQSNSSLDLAVKSYIGHYPSTYPITGQQTVVKIPYHVAISTTLTKVYDEECSYSFSFAPQPSNPDANVSYLKNDSRDPYAIIAIPVHPPYLVGIGVNGLISPEMSKSFITSLKTNFGSKVYDVQRVPYFPVDSLILNNYDGFGKIKSKNSDRVYAFVMSSTADFHYVKQVDVPQDNNYKVAVNCDMYRLVSPDGKAIYEFSPAKNFGVSTFEIEGTLRPFTPYLHVAPVFSGLYGQDFNDYRGLVSIGDCSIATGDSAWAEYQNNNKNYQAIFDRNIESQELQNKWARRSDIVNAITGSLAGGVQGAFMGASMSGGNPVGAVAGGVVSGVASVAGGVMDVYANEQMRQDNVDRSKKVFELELGNVKARGITLSKTSAFDYNSKEFAYIEYWSCTDEERQFFESYIRQKGMTIGAVAQLSTTTLGEGYNYVEGTILEIEINDDSHVVSALNNLLEGGIKVWHSSQQ